MRTYVPSPIQGIQIGLIIRFCRAAFSSWQQSTNVQEQCQDKYTGIRLRLFKKWFSGINVSSVTVVLFFSSQFELINLTGARDYWATHIKVTTLPRATEQTSGGRYHRKPGLRKLRGSIKKIVTDDSTFSLSDQHGKVSVTRKECNHSRLWPIMVQPSYPPQPDYKFHLFRFLKSINSPAGSNTYLTLALFTNLFVNKTDISGIR